MDILSQLLTSLLVKQAERHLPGLWERVRQTLFGPANAKNPLEFLRRIGALAPADIRSFVAQWEPAQRLSANEREIFCHMLMRLARQASFHATQGTTRSGVQRLKDLYRQFENIELPKRASGEPIGPGHEWTLKRFLGKGSFGEVWSAEHPLMARPHAVKFFTTEDGRAWLLREARNLKDMAQRLGAARNVVHCVYVAAEAEPYPYLSQEYMGGGTLEDWILAPPDRRPGEREELLRDVARGLAALHRQDICHRDLKPANVLLAGDSGTDADDLPDETAAKIADFGLGRVAPRRGSGSGAGGVEHEFARVGTELYLPPEAATPAAECDPKQYDVFAFGVMWYQAIVGRIERPPYDFAARLEGSAGIDARIVRVLSRCLAQPDQRFPSAVELCEALELDDLSDDWQPPAGKFDVGPLAREYLLSLTT